ncbi:MAG TPA: glycoside hydrolase family 28 protein [Bryobacteraceae bacterium]|nr:glycoside hydrolase family 28 protein [Bryobacteraceae bacterium]
MNRVIASVCFWAAVAAAQPGRAPVYDVKSYGATGAGKIADTGAINRAITAANAAGGGTVYFPAGTYLSGSVRLKSNVTLYLDSGAVIQASSDPQAYDEAEPNPSIDKYQDFGHSHWRNSLMWGENVENVAILGQGLINGKGALTREADQRIANKAISLKLSRNVTIRDVSMLLCGHFAILATGVDNLTIDNIKIDTNRDGIDVDASRNVRISNVSVNSPWDDAIVLKASYGLGLFRDTSNVTITNCFVSGYDMGTLLDGTYQRHAAGAPDRGGPTGRIKLGTESSGGFKNITISNCVFEYSRGLALETVDGGVLEDITISNITMRDVVNSPIFLRLGRRMRSPEGTPIGQLRRVNISDVVVYNADPRYASLITGIPGHDIEDVKLNHIRLLYAGGGTREQAAIVPPEGETEYPEPYRFGPMPAYGFFLRHVKGIELNDLEIGYLKQDLRPPFQLQDVDGADFNNLKAQHADQEPTFVLKDVRRFHTWHSSSGSDASLDEAGEKRL